MVLTLWAIAKGAEYWRGILQAQDLHMAEHFLGG